MDARRTTAYRQYCPISRALDVLGDRWSLLIMRDLIVGTTRFNDLARGLPSLSRSLLVKRLRQLERAGVLEHVDGRYLLTEAGRDLEPVIFALARWGAQWSFEDPHPDELDAELLVWWLHSRLDTSDLPGPRHVLHLCFSDDLRQYWIVVERGVASVCRHDPGLGVNLTLSSDVSTLYQVWLGRMPVRRALDCGALRAEGLSEWTQRLPTILGLSPVAPIVAEFEELPSAVTSGAAGRVSATPTPARRG